MKRGIVADMCACLLGLCLVGCGGHSAGIVTPPPDTCSGLKITGTLVDSLSKQPVTRAWAVLETGTPLIASGPLYEFYPAQTASTDANGAFSVCAHSVPSPSAMVIVALDASGKAYPPFVSAIAGTKDFGSIPMGGCTGMCGFEGSEQATTPAIIAGDITSAPVAKTGTVVAQYAMAALDGSKSTGGLVNLWSLAMPAFDSTQNVSFATAAGPCANGVHFCTSYKFTLPSEKPLQPFVLNGVSGYIQEAGAPEYMIFATPDGAFSCTPSFGFSAYQTDLATPLTATPGTHMKASGIDFSGCH